MSGPAIVTTTLTRRFGDVLAVDGVDLEVPRRGVYGFLGPNGAGKTTTIRMLLGLLRPHRGSVQLFGEDLASHRLALLGRVGALVEMPSLYDHLSGRDNLEVTRRLLGTPRRRVGEVLELVGLTDAARRRVGGYSLGMRQRLGLALALLGEPELLILDEPTNGLDPAGIREIRELIVHLAGEHGVTVFLSSHLLAEVEQMADHIGIVNGGRLRFQGSLAELQAQRRGYLALATDRPAATETLLRQTGWEVLASSNGHLHTAPGNGAELDSAAIGALNAVLVGGGHVVHHLSHTQPSLESLFLQMTETTEKGDAGQ